MHKITDQIWIGDSSDAEHADLKKHKLSAMLNVAHDYQCGRGWSDHVLYAHCGIVDGPGSTLAAYHSAVLQLASLASGGRSTLVFDHNAGGRAVAIVVMTLHLCHSRLGWDKWLEIVNERMERKEFCPHVAHRDAFNRFNWRLLSFVVG